jgi:hypothetical protein
MARDCGTAQLVLLWWHVWPCHSIRAVGVKMVQLRRRSCFVGLCEGALTQFVVLLSVGTDCFAQVRGLVDLGPAACRLDSCQMAKPQKVIGYT